MKHIMYTIALLAACTGCTSELPDKGEETNFLRLLSVELTGTEPTKTLVTTSTLDKIQAYVTKAADGVDYAATSSILFTKSGSEWTTTSPVEITAALGSALVNACYPAGEIVNENKTLKTTVKVLASQDFAGVDQTDYLYSDQKTATSSARAISLSMNHALAKVSFRIEKSLAVTETMTLKGIEIISRTSLLQKGDGTMLLSNGTLNGLTSTDSLKLAGSVALNVTQNTPNVTCLVAPMNAKESVLSFTLKVQIGSETEPRTFTTASVTAVQWLKENHYTYHITLDKMGGSLTDVTIEKWKTDASPNTSIGI